MLTLRSEFKYYTKIHVEKIPPVTYPPNRKSKSRKKK